MSWNEPGGGNRDPWSGSGRNQGPPDLDELLKKLQARINRLFGRRPRSGGGDGGGSAIGIGLIAGVLVVVWLLSGFFMVDEGKRGVVLRFGDYVSTAMPGPHWHWPYPIGEVRIVDVSARRTVRIGYQSPNRIIPDEALMLTGDENIVSVQLAVQWHVSDPSAFLFTLVEPEQTLKQLTESALREVVGKREMGFVLTEGRAEVVESTMELVQQSLDNYDAGIRVVEMAIQDVQPPDPVQPAFSEAIRAREDEQRFINEALAYRNQVLPQAKGEAARILEEAQGYRAQVVAQAEGSAARFLAVLEEYREAPEVTRERLYIQAMQQVLSGTSKILMSGNGGNPLMYMPLDRLLQGANRAGGEEPATQNNAASPRQGQAPSQMPLTRDRVRDREVR